MFYNQQQSGFVFKNHQPPPSPCLSPFVSFSGRGTHWRAMLPCRRLSLSRRWSSASGGWLNPRPTLVRTARRSVTCFFTVRRERHEGDTCVPTYVTDKAGSFVSPRRPLVCLLLLVSRFIRGGSRRSFVFFDPGAMCLFHVLCSR